MCFVFVFVFLVGFTMEHHFLDFGDYFLPFIREVFNYNLLK